jgi:hypothetical protein
MTIAPPTAVRKPSTWKPTSSLPDSQAVSCSMNALMTTRNKPIVRTTRGNESRVSTGFTMAVTTPRIRATTRRGSSFSSISARPWVGPLNQMPSKSQAAMARATALVTSQVTNRMRPTGGAY